MEAITILESEHRVIEQVLDCLEAMASRAERAGKVEEEPASQAIDFLRAFADHCHHGKEEDLLFPLLEERGFPADAGPTRVMRGEHLEGRGLIASMTARIAGAAGGADDDVRAFVAAARAYVRLLRDHIRKEDECLFRMAREVLSDEDGLELMRRYQRVEEVEMGQGTHEKYLDVADRLAARYGVATGRTARTGCSGKGTCSHR